MANESAIRAGQAYVELYADNSRLIQNLQQSEVQTRAFGRNVTAMGETTARSMDLNLGGATGRVAKSFRTFGMAARMLGPDLAGAAGEMKGIGIAARVLNVVLSGPLGWGLLAAGAATAAIQLLSTKKEVASVTEVIKKLNDEIKKNMGVAAQGLVAETLPSGEIVARKEAATAASQHGDAQKKLADAQRDLSAATQAVTETQKEYNAAVTQWHKLQGVAAMDKTARAILAGTMVAAAQKLEEAKRVQQEATATLTAAKEEETRASEESAKLAREKQVAEVMKRPPTLREGLPPEPAAANIFEDQQAIEDINANSAKLGAERAKEQALAEIAHEREVADFTRRQDEEIARLEIELSGRTKAEKLRALLELQQAKEREAAAGLDEEAQARLAQRHGLEMMVVDAGDAAQKASRQTVAGTFSAAIAGRMGGSADVQLTRRAAEKQVKLQEKMVNALEKTKAWVLK